MNPMIRLPSWQAPFAGAVVLSLLSLYFAGSLERPVTAGWVAGHALVGAAIGVLVALCDVPNSPGTLVSRFLALISPATALMPIFGLPFNVAAWLANRRSTGGLRTLSLVTLVAAVVWSVFVSIFLVLAELKYGKWK